MGAAEEDFDFAPTSAPPSPKSIRVADIGFSLSVCVVWCMQCPRVDWTLRLEILKEKSRRRTRGEGTEGISDKI